ncbi:hypothetical protein [Streptomonospora alba]|uniref:hypothetical protein n=1 Tax=Streptomonospora alba TaxID=183763 RepID=UPI0012EDE117|nr:hypothetical protein [Streptomonospora alba]
MSDTRSQAPAHSPFDQPVPPARIAPVLLAGGAAAALLVLALVLRCNGRRAPRGRHRRS